MDIRPIDANSLHAEISKWPEPVVYKDWVQSAIATAPTLTSEVEYRKYRCPHCAHSWLEDRDATDYPEYCPGCGEPLHQDEPERKTGFVDTEPDPTPSRYIWR